MSLVSVEGTDAGGDLGAADHPGVSAALTDETEAAALTNLLMVGFDPVQMDRKHVTSFDRRMLRKTNERAGDCATTSDSTRVR